MAVRRCVVVVLIVTLLALAALGGQPEALFWAGMIGAIIAIPLLLPLGFILANAAGAAIIVGMVTKSDHPNSNRQWPEVQILTCKHAYPYQPGPQH